MVRSVRRKPSRALCARSRGSESPSKRTDRRASVDANLWGGDDPSLYITVGPTTIILMGNAKRGFTVYRDMVAQKTKMMGAENPRDYDQPAWGFVITNGEKEITCGRNAGEFLVSLRDATPTTGKRRSHAGAAEVNVTISAAEGKSLGSSLNRTMKAFPKVGKQTSTVFKKAGSWVTYKTVKADFFAPFDETSH